MKGIEQAKPKPGKDKWNACWSEHKEETPPYYHSEVIREHGEFKFVTNGYEYSKFCEIRDRLLNEYCKDMPVYEFGCGTGHNKTSDWKGFDWSESAVEKLKSKGFEAEVFNMFSPTKMKIPGAVVTFHALEQLGKNFKPFLEFLLESKPQVVVHVEPLIELYEDNLLDYLAVQYHRKRGYLEGYLDAVINSGAEILELKRNHFGSLYHEAYSVFVWR